MIKIQRRKNLFIVIAILICSLAYGQDSENNKITIDPRSYTLGNIGAFGEMVSLGIKELALSAAIEPEEMDELIDEARNVAKRNNVKIFREKEFLVTDLFPQSVTNGKHVLLIYTGNTKEKYLALKDKKVKLIESGQYKGIARKEIARKLGQMLSYPESKINELINENRP